MLVSFNLHPIISLYFIQWNSTAAYRAKSLHIHGETDRGRIPSGQPSGHSKRFEQGPSSALQYRLQYSRNAFVAGGDGNRRPLKVLALSLRILAEAITGDLGVRIGPVKLGGSINRTPNS